MQAPAQLDAGTAAQALEGIRCVILDCDGVLWRGSQPIANVAEALHELRSQGKRLLFVTNNASRSRAGCLAKFKSLGIDAEAHEIVSASYAAAAYLASQPGIGPAPVPASSSSSQLLNSAGTSATQQERKRVLVIANSGVEHELDAAGVAWVGGEAWQPPASLVLSSDAMNRLVLDASIGAVLVGWDPHFSYAKLVYAAACLRELPGCVFVASNPDAADVIGMPCQPATWGAPLPGHAASVAVGLQGSPVAPAVGSSHKDGLSAAEATAGNGDNATSSSGHSTDAARAQPGAMERMMPGTGCIVSAVAMAAGRQPVIVGKGGSWLLPHLLQLYGLEPGCTAIVGDRLDTDIAMGLAGGLRCILPLTGVTTLQEALTAPADQRPHVIIPSVAALAGLG